MIVYTTSSTDQDLLGILSLQQKNLAKYLTPDEIASQGFVTVHHSFEDIKKMNDIEESIIVKSNDMVVAYLLAMTAASKQDIPVLIPMFEAFDKLTYKGKVVSSYHYIVVGQVCVDKAFRGQGILDEAYAAYKNQFENKYDFAITEIATKNIRSIKAHQRIGFEPINEYIAPDGEAWSIVVWDWT